MTAEQGDVVRVQERAHGQPGLVALLLVESFEQGDRLVGREGILDRRGVVLAEPVRVGPDPLREPVFVEQVRFEVRGDVLGDLRPVVLDRQEVALAVGVVEVRVRHMPLALVEGPVAAGAEPVAEGRHRVRREPEHVGAVRALRQPVGLRDTVQRRVVPGQERGAARRARR